MVFDGLERLAVGDPKIADVVVFPEKEDEAVVNAKSEESPHFMYGAPENQPLTVTT